MYLPVILLFYTFLESKVDKVHRVVRTGFFSLKKLKN